MRGSRWALPTSAATQRSIPACAGEPIVSGAQARQEGVYPRVCGGAYLAHLVHMTLRGLSPRVRGSLCIHLHVLVYLGSIPACAGEPRQGGHLRWPHWVYPRVCGGAMPGARMVAVRNGLSPRVRGSHDQRRDRQVGIRSIPACAGEPFQGRRAHRRRWVYPRVCGGATATANGILNLLGLSPRVRGSQHHVLLSNRTGRSIPACAGEPAFKRCDCGERRVYPRVCGGAGGGGTNPSTYDGLSPRVRGSPLRPWACRTKARSIPACAGEPMRRVLYRNQHRVYPRVCGGAAAIPAKTVDPNGLSPRVRGSPVHPHEPLAGYGSIPACAGEPPPPRAGRRRHRVYPRVCGGAPWRLDERRLPLFAKGISLSVLHEVHAVGIHDGLGRLTQES